MEAHRRVAGKPQESAGLSEARPPDGARPGPRAAGSRCKPLWVKLRIANLDRELEVLPGRSLLEAAFAAGLNVPHSCRGGNCGSCAALLLEGEYFYPNGIPLGLTEQQRAHGQVLLCQVRARSDITVEIPLPVSADDIAIKRLPARIEHCEPLAHDVLRVTLRLPIAESFSFQAGQYLDVLLPGGRRRSFSIASAPGSAPLLELQIRRAVGGEFTEALFAAVSAGVMRGTMPAAASGAMSSEAADVSLERALRSALLTIEGPLGQFRYHESAAPMLLVGGGTGLAPLDSIMRHVIERNLKRPMRLFWGCRAARDLYADARLRGYVRQGALQEYVPVLSEAAESFGGEHGLVHQAVLRRIADLDRYDVYAAGPPAMIAAVRREFAARGAQQIHFDSFDYAPDALERQRSAAASTS